jgi:hypothetical protein
MSDLSARIAKAKDVDLVAFLRSVGVEPSRKGGLYYYYYSPFREETDASFAVNIRKNEFTDYGDGTYGDILDLVQRLRHCTLSEAINIVLSCPDMEMPFSQQQQPKERVSGIDIISANDIQDISLLTYIQSRRINVDIARKYCREVHLKFPYSKTNPDRVHVAIGFQSDEGGFELRSSYLKVASSPKGVTTLKNGDGGMWIIEGFMDFLSILTYYKKDSLRGTTYVLNGISYLPVVAEFIRGSHVNLLIDNDDPANAALEKVENIITYTDYRHLYKGHKDFNAYICSL